MKSKRTHTLIISHSSIYKTNSVLSSIQYLFIKIRFICLNHEEDESVPFIWKSGIINKVNKIHTKIKEKHAIRLIRHDSVLLNKSLTIDIKNDFILFFVIFFSSCCRQNVFFCFRQMRFTELIFNPCRSPPTEFEFFQHILSIETGFA